MNVLLQIQQNLNSFTTVEKKIADFIIDNPERILSMSVQQVAAALGTSPSALVRFSRAMNMKGFSELKQKISAALTELSSVESLKEVEEHDSVGKIKEKVRLRMNHMVEKINTLLDDTEVEKVTEIIEKVDNVFVFGLGASSLVAQDVYQKFTRIGKHVFFTQDVHLMVTKMSVFKENACLLAISNSGKTQEVLKLSKSAESMKIPIIAITGKNKSPLADISETVLISASGEDIPVRTAATMSLMAQLYVVDILFYTYVSRNFTESMDRIHLSRQTIKAFEKIK